MCGGDKRWGEGEIKCAIYKNPPHPHPHHLPGDNLYKRAGGGWATALALRTHTLWKPNNAETVCVLYYTTVPNLVSQRRGYLVKKMKIAGPPDFSRARIFYLLTLSLLCARGYRFRHGNPGKTREKSLFFTTKLARKNNTSCSVHLYSSQLYWNWRWEGALAGAIYSKTRARVAPCIDTPPPTKNAPLSPSARHCGEPCITVGQPRQERAGLTNAVQWASRSQNVECWVQISRGGGVESRK